MRMKSQILIEMNGAADDTSFQTIVIGATNNPQIIDEAMRRRLEKRVYIPLPTKEDRTLLFRKSFEAYVLSDDVDFDLLAEKSENYSCADISVIVRDTIFVMINSICRGKSSPEEIRLVSEDAKAHPERYPITMSMIMDSIARTSTSVSTVAIEECENFAKNFGSS